jgi:hypothetical protein
MHAPVRLCICAQIVIIKFYYNKSSNDFFSTLSRETSIYKINAAPFFQFNYFVFATLQI